MTEKNFIKCRELSLKFWAKFAQLFYAQLIYAHFLPNFCPSFMA
jgi:hypothetical protein